MNASLNAEINAFIAGRSAPDCPMDDAKLGRILGITPTGRTVDVGSAIALVRKGGNPDSEVVVRSALTELVEMENRARRK